MSKKIIIIACSIFKSELNYLSEAGKINVPVVYIDSMLHMYPEKLQEILDIKIEEYCNYKIILAFGDCHSKMLDYENNKNISRVPGINCCEILLGTEKYKKVRKEGAFILLPEWLVRWKEVFIEYMGFSSENSAKNFMNDMHKKLVYVDTGYQVQDKKLLHDISEYLGLPVEIYNGSVAELEKTLIHLINNEVDHG